MLSSAARRAHRVRRGRAAGAAPRIVERVLAVVDARPVLLSELRLARQVRGEADGAPRLEALIDEHLMFAEAVAPAPGRAHRGGGGGRRGLARHASRASATPTRCAAWRAGRRRS